MPDLWRMADGFDVGLEELLQCAVAASEVACASSTSTQPSSALVEAATAQDCVGYGAEEWSGPCRRAVARARLGVSREVNACGAGLYQPRCGEGVASVIRRVPMPSCISRIRWTPTTRQPRCIESFTVSQALALGIAVHGVAEICHLPQLHSVNSGGRYHPGTSDLARQPNLTKESHRANQPGRPQRAFLISGSPCPSRSAQFRNWSQRLRKWRYW